MNAITTTAVNANEYRTSMQRAALHLSLIHI